MKCSVMLLAIFCAVSVAQTWTEPVKVGDDEPRWIWGYAADNNKARNTDNRNDDQEETDPIPADPCASYNPVKPNFKVPGRKISDEKCEEYKWEKVIKKEKERRNVQCENSKDDGIIHTQAVGGRDTLSGEFPHMGAIGWKAAVGDGYVFKCGSTIISTKFVLTAAHCSKASSLDTSLAEVEPKIIRIHDKNLKHQDETGINFSKDVEIFRIIVHPEYKPPKKYFDIALMELKQEIEFNELVQPACLWTKPDVTELGQDATLTGWGVLRSGSFNISDELQAADVNIINASFCDQLLFSSRNRNWWGLEEHQLCAGKLEGGVDACQGDSGGPLQVKQYIPNNSGEHVYYVIGVTSFGIGCALPNTPGIYTRVSSFVDWIDGYVWT